MFIEEKKIELGQSGPWNDLTLKQMGLPNPKSKFWKGGNKSLNLPSQYDVYDASNSRVYQDYQNKEGRGYSVLFSDGTFSYPMNQYVDLYNNTYDSNDLNYVKSEVFKFIRMYISNLYETPQYSDKKISMWYLSTGILILENCIDWLENV